MSNNEILLSTSTDNQKTASMTFNGHKKMKDSEKIPNLKEFVKYLDQTIRIFDEHVADEDFEKKDSDVHKIFKTLFNIYTNPRVNKEQNKKTKKHTKKNNISHQTFQESNKSHILFPEQDIVMQHIKKNIKQKNIPKWENNRNDFDSEKIVRELYKKSLRDLKAKNNNIPKTDIDMNIHDNKTSLVKKLKHKKNEHIQNNINMNTSNRLNNKSNHLDTHKTNPLVHHKKEQYTNNKISDSEYDLSDMITITDNNNDNIFTVCENNNGYADSICENKMNTDFVSSSNLHDSENQFICSIYTNEDTIKIDEKIKNLKKMLNK